MGNAKATVAEIIENYQWYPEKHAATSGYSSNIRKFPIDKYATQDDWKWMLSKNDKFSFKKI